MRVLIFRLWFGMIISYPGMSIKIGHDFQVRRSPCIQTIGIIWSFFMQWRALFVQRLAAYKVKSLRRCWLNLIGLCQTYRNPFIC